MNVPSVFLIAAALLAGGKARDWKEGAAQAAQSIDSGAATRKLQALIDLSRSLASK